jgi:subtilase family serine protease
MVFTFLRSVMHRLALFTLGAVFLVPVVLSTPAVAAGPVVNPLISDWQYLSSGPTPPSQAACNAANPPGGRRCFNPASMSSAYNYASLLANHNEGQGKTIAVVDSFGSDTIRNDLSVFDTAFGLPHMCGETPAITCSSSTPKFNILEIQGSPPTNPPPPNNGTGLENHNLWALEVSLDVEWAHATAPLANILLVTTPTAETLGVQDSSSS